MQKMAVPRYALRGAPGFSQVEPGAGFWPRCEILRMVSIEELTAKIGSKVQAFTRFDERKEFTRLQGYYKRRQDAVPGLSRFLSDTIFFDPPPAGAVLSMAGMAAQRGIKNGVELATLFEAETPGLWHRHVLNVILDPTVMGGAGLTLSPPRQALIWAALDVAIASALAAAWNYKWIAEGLQDVDYRRRPVEYVIAENEASKKPIELTVLYDLAVERQNGRIVRERPKSKGPQPSPGTPRHPAYPSGHSTYSAAASAVLGCLFADYEDPRPALRALDWKAEFKALAENIGVARFYGGVHWESDHTFGRLIGEAVGQLVIAQLNASGVPVRPAPEIAVPKAEKLETAAQKFDKNCGKARNNFCRGVAVEGLVQQNFEAI
jgi:membrane-associated phospholipid phosphatase